MVSNVDGLLLVDLIPNSVIVTLIAVLISPTIESLHTTVCTVNEHWLSVFMSCVYFPVQVTLLLVVLGHSPQLEATMY